MSHVVFTSDELPDHFDDRERFAQWHEIFESLTCCSDYFRSEERPFQAHFRWAGFGDAYVTRFGGTFNRIARTASAIARGPDDDFCILLNSGAAPFATVQRGQEVLVLPGAAHLATNGEAAEILAAAQCEINTVTVSQDRLRALVPDITDLLARPLDPGQPSVRHLGRYVESIVGLDIAGDRALEEHIGTTLLDLLALGLGAGRDTAAIARMRGVRAARLREVFSAIGAGFTDPAFTPGVLAARLGLSPRYIQDLLHEAGTSFTERVLDLRLRKAQQMLTSVARQRLKVSEIALACGFSDVSYFNQAFRRRFGASPTQLRA